MKINIFERAEYTSRETDLDLMLNYLIEILKQNGIEVNRFELELNPEKFIEIKGYALPVVQVDGEIISAGAYDFNFLNKKDIKKLSPVGCTVKKCESCPGRKFCHKNL